MSGHNGTVDHGWPLYRWTVVVQGEPRSKGSKRPFTVRRRDGRIGAGVAETRQTILSEQAFRDTAAVMRRAPGVDEHVQQFLGHGVIVNITAIFSPPKWVVERRRTSPRKKGFEPRHLVKPDKDKVERLVLDALTGIAYRDDAQVFDGRTEKRYAQDGEMPRVIAEIMYFEPEIAK